MQNCKQLITSTKAFFKQLINEKKQNLSVYKYSSSSSDPDDPDARISRTMTEEKIPRLRKKKLAVFFDSDTLFACLFFNVWYGTL